MFPRLLTTEVFYLPTYGFMAALGLIVALLVTSSWRKKWRGSDDAWNLGIIVILSGILGAKILMLIVDWRHYQSEPVQHHAGGMNAATTSAGEKTLPPAWC